MGKRFVFIFVLVFLISLSFVVAEDNNSNNQTTKTEEQVKCENSDGTWKTFNNICADKCTLYLPNIELVCPPTITESCDCGSEKCWSGSKCKENPMIENNDDNETENDNDNDENETKIDKEDCWKCSKWSICINHTQTRTCTQIANCTDDDDDDEEKPKIVKKCELRKKIKDYYINKECPEECTCTGSVIKCELASGRIMSIYAGKSGNVIVQIKGVNMSTNVTLYKNENGTIEGIFRGNKTRIIKVLPDEVKEKIKEKIKARLENEEINLDDDGLYKIKAHKKARFLLIIPVRENIEGQADSETGNIIIIKKGSWWGFLARDVKE